MTIWSKYYSLEVDYEKEFGDGKYSGHLGNFSDAGWFWDFQEKDLLAVFGHLAYFDGDKERLNKDLKRLDFEEIKKDLHKMDFDFFVRIFSGWRGLEKIEELLDSLLTESEAENDEERINKLLYFDISNIHKETVKRLKDYIIEMIDDSDNFDELLANIRNFEVTYYEVLDEVIEEMTMLLD
jgi:hypothetical protein